MRGLKGFRVFMGSNVAGHELAISLEALVSSVSHQLSARAMSNQGMGSEGMGQTLGHER